MVAVPSHLDEHELESDGRVASNLERHRSPSVPTSPLIVVSVGTDHHPFDRLVAHMDRWAAEHPRVHVVIQRGSASATDHAESRPLIPHAELCRLFASASAVVTHGGPSTVMDIRAAGRRPIVFPRDPAHGEHVDDHQLRFGRHLARHRIATIAYEHDDLIAAVEEALASPDRYLVSGAVEPAPGVVAFARVVDDLLGVNTPLGPSRSAVEPPAGGDRRR